MWTLFCKASCWMNPIKVLFTQHHIRASVVRPRQRPEESCPSQGSCSSCRKCRGLVVGSAYILSKPHGLSGEYSQQHLSGEQHFQNHMCPRNDVDMAEPLGQPPRANPVFLCVTSHWWSISFVTRNPVKFRHQTTITDSEHLQCWILSICSCEPLDHSIVLISQWRLLSYPPPPLHL